MNRSADLSNDRRVGKGLSRYDITKSYAWNYENAPDTVGVDVSAVPGEWDFCGLAVDSPLGMPAGPLLNGRWCLYYASLGFDVLTYKTVRSVERACYPLPNLQPVSCGQLQDGNRPVRAIANMRGSWAVSFGMPSQAPAVWRADVERTRAELPKGKLLSVSVVATVQDGWSMEDLADDYAQCARWAVESGADCVETNFSCPNVTTCDGQLYQEPETACLVAARVRDAIGQMPYVVKIGHVTTYDQGTALAEALAPYIDGLAMTNSVAATVSSIDGQLLFEGHPRGICGDATREASLAQVKLFVEIVQERRLDMQLIGVGGASNGDHVIGYLDAGANAVHIASAAMVDPLVGIEIRRWLASAPGRKVRLESGS